MIPHVPPTGERVGPLQVATDLSPEPTEQLKIRLVWAAMRGMQQELMACPATFILLGGARGPGKSEGMLIGDIIRHLQVMRDAGAKARILILRRRLKHAEDTIEDIRWAWELIGGKVPSGDASKIMRFPDGSTMRFGYLEDVGDAAQYSGKNFTYIGVEEINQIGSQEAVLRLLGTLRGEGPERKMVGTCNWEGAGTGWLKEMFVRPYPKGRAIIHRELPMYDGKRYKFTLAYIPSKVTDNLVISRTRPEYIANLLMATEHNPQLRKSWLEGDPDALSGTFFQEFFTWKNRGGVLHPFQVPVHWPRFVCGDWGTAKPFAFYWIAEAAETVRTHREGLVIPEGSLIAYREYYGIQQDEFGRITPNVGVRMSAFEVGQEIWARGAKDPPRQYLVLDPAQFRQQDGPTVAQELYRGEYDAAVEDGRKPSGAWIPADNTRAGDQGHPGGFDQMRMRLRGAPCAEAGGQPRPLFYAFETCPHLLRVWPTMVHDDKKPEDMAKGPGVEDHPLDAIRYGKMSRPMRRRKTREQHTPPGVWTWSEQLRRAGIQGAA